MDGSSYSSSGFGWAGAAGNGPVRIVVRYANWVYISVFVAAGFLLVIGMLTQSVSMIVLAGLELLLFGARYAAGREMLVVTPSSVTTKWGFGGDRKQTPIAGLGELEVTRRRLVRRSDGKRIASVGFGVEQSDLRALEAAIATAQTLAAPASPYARP